MPKSTNKFPYEFRILNGLGQLKSQLLENADDEMSFYIGLDTHFNVAESCQFDCDFTLPDGRRLEEAYPSYIYMDVIDNGIYLFLRWENIPQPQMESLLNIKFEPSDFQSSYFGNGSYSLSHGVMF